jgi:hypothetical protein
MTDAQNIKLMNYKLIRSKHDCAMIKKVTNRDYFVNSAVL